MKLGVSLLVPKALCFATAGGGLCAGGGLLYTHMQPKTWKERLIQQGHTVLTSSDTSKYKAIYNDHKDSTEWKGENDLKSASDESSASTQLNTFCSGKLEGQWTKETDLENKLISFCTEKGILTVKNWILAFLDSSTTISWMDKDDQYKNAFAVYRYHNKFIGWMKEEKRDDAEITSLNSTSKINDNHSKHKEACTTALAKKVKDISNIKSYSENVMWWCKPLTHNKIQDRITNQHKGWTQANDWNSVKDTWQHTSKVTSEIQKHKQSNNTSDASAGTNGGSGGGGDGDSSDGNGKSSDDSSDVTDTSGSELQGDDYKNWCTEKLSKEFKDDDDYYQNVYIMAMSVCKQTSSAQES